MPAKILDIVGEKGGIGKTTTAIIFATLLRLLLKYRVLIVGFDPQAHIEKLVGYEKELLNLRPSVFQALGPEKTCSIQDIIVPTELNKVDYTYLSQDPRKVASRTIPADQIIRGPDIVCINDTAMKDTLSQHEGWAFFLRDALQPVMENYDFIVIDTNPTGGFLLAMALAAGDFAVTPLKPEELDVAGLRGILTMIRRTTDPNMNPKLKIAGVFFNQIMSQWSLHQSYMDQVRTSLLRDVANCPVCDTNIKLLSPIATGTSAHSPVIVREPYSPASKMWWHLFQEVSIHIGGALPERVYTYVQALDKGQEKATDPFLLPKFHQYMQSRLGQASNNATKGA